MPNAQVDRVIRSVQAQQGQLSKVLTKAVPLLAEPGVWESIVQAVGQAFNERGIGSSSG
jgi:hypothetical protein